MKKIVFFIVEGITDQISLENIIDTLVDEYNSSSTHGDNVIFEISDGDITSDYSSEPSNIKSKITKIIKGNGKRKYAPTDYKEVIHIIDTDGAYIDNERHYHLCLTMRGNLKWLKFAIHFVFDIIKIQKEPSSNSTLM